MDKFKVIISEDAEKDLDAIYDFIALADGVEQARVAVTAVLDGRRNMSVLLQQRLLQ